MEWCIKSVNRSALTAFSPYGSYLATGTMAGAVDLQFSSSAHMDIFELDFASDDRQMILVGSSPSSERFNRLSWGKRLTNSEEYPFGLIAGGLVDGNIGLWNPKSLISKHINTSDTSENAFVGNLPRQKGSVRGLEFNSLYPNHLASGGEEGDICIWDVSKPSEPTHFLSPKGSRSATQGEISFLSWNNKVQHILASTSYNGTTVVWDLKKQKPVISFADSVRRSCSVLQWNPDIATQLIVASDEDSSPSLSLWDMRNILAPVKEFVGHTQGVVAMSWCPSDSTYLLTCAKDNHTICWDTVSGEIVAELPAGTNRNFDVHWYSKIPGVISASSFHGKIGIYNIEGCGRYGLAESDIGAASLKAPKWYKSKAGVSFGFGGKLVSFYSTEAGSSKVYAHDLVTEHALASRSSEFGAAIKNGDKSSLKLLCERKSQESESDEDRETWGFMKVMFTEDGTTRSKLLSHLGFSLPAEKSEIIDNEVSQQDVLRHDESIADKEGFATDNGEDFFNNLPSPRVDTPLSTSKNEYVNGDTVNESQQEMNGLEESSDASFDDAVQRALIVGDYKGAVAQCVSANRLADALVIAHIGGPTLWKRTRDQYLKINRSQYLKVVSAMVNNDLMSIAKTRPLKSWKETLALFCTVVEVGFISPTLKYKRTACLVVTNIDDEYVEFAQADEWTLLCDTLAARLVAADDTTAATLCYICARNIDKSVEMWSKNLAKEHGDKPYVDRLQDLMEKIFVFALAAGLKRFSASLYKLVEKYAEILTSQGLLTTAMEYLNLLGTEELSNELKILRNRISLLTKPDTEIEETGTYESSQFQNGFAYDVNQSSYGATDAYHRYYQVSGPPQVQPTAPSSPYIENYQQQSDVSFSRDYGVRPTYQTNGQSSRFMPYPSIPAPTVTRHFPPVNTQPPVNFVPTHHVLLKNAEQYLQPSSLVSQSYQGAANPSYQPRSPGVPYGATTSQVGPTPGHMMSQVSAPIPPSKVFTPVSNLGPGINQLQPPDATQSAPAQKIVTPVAPPTVHTVDTSNVLAHQKAVVATLRRLYNETIEGLGGKKQEIEATSKKLGALFAKLNNGDMSKNVSEKLQQLCQAVDRADYSTALRIQMSLTTSEWDECNAWLTPLKRMIKIKQNSR